MGRFFLLRPLLGAYRRSDESRFAEAARDYIEDWMEHFPWENIEAKGNTCMDVAIRLGTHGRGGWTVALFTFWDEPSWDTAFRERVINSIEQQAHQLWKRGIPSRNWGNHRIFGLDGLLLTALRLPFLKEADAMVSFAARDLAREARQQMLPDGAHVEQTLGYHSHMLETFLYFQRLGELVPEARMELPLDRLKRGVEYSLHTFAGGINDTAAQCGDPSLEQPMKTARQQRAQLGEVDDPSWTPPLDRVYPDAGQVFLRSSWDQGADFLAFDAGPYSGSHCHLARLGVVFRSGGRLWLADPGTFDYEMSNPFSVYGRSTPAHCTLNLNGLNQGLGGARLKERQITSETAFLYGVYDGGYWDGPYTWGFQEGLGRGTYGRHERMILWIRGEYLLVFDGMMGDPAETVEQVWQLAPVEGWEADEGLREWRTKGEDPGFYLRQICGPSRVEMTVCEGQKDPLRGWFTEKNATGFSPAPQVCFRYPLDNAFHITLAMTTSDERQPPEVKVSRRGSARVVELIWPDGRADEIVLSDSMAAALDAESGYVSDAPLVWLRRSPSGAVDRHFLSGGTYLQDLATGVTL